jgi:hypothetical protein
MLFLQTFMINLVLTKFSGPKHHAVGYTVPICACFYVCHTGPSEWGGRQKKLAYTREPSRPDMIPPTLLSVWQPFLTSVGSFTHKLGGQIGPHQ